MPDDRARSKGFTLIELMVTLAIVVIMLALAAPSFRTFQQNSQLTSTANSFLAAALAARAEAMKRQLNAYVRPSDNANWANGWTVYVDGDWDGLDNTPSVDVLVSQQVGIPANIQIANDTTLTDATSHFVMFTGAGYLASATTATAPAAPVTQVAIQFSNPNGSRLVIMNAAGRIRVCNPATDTACTLTNTF